MSFYESEIKRIAKNIYGNQGQVNLAVAIKRFIDQNFEKDLNLDLLSSSQFVSKYHLIRLFKKYYGQTPRQYLIGVRIQKAKAHLKKGESVTETCFAVGFESLGSFSILFKNRVGMSPMKFRKEQLSRSNSDHGL
ncbi:MAG: AraC family transcriptional regulator [Bacteroidota bacterium]